jgi:hypothetical protein
LLAVEREVARREERETAERKPVTREAAASALWKAELSMRVLSGPLPEAKGFSRRVAPGKMEAVTG